jgi:D-xylose 1-dehydrogenase (NADP+, D-xylono-1,4-lactone-forming)
MKLAAHLDDLCARDWDARVEEPLRVAVVGLGGFARRFALPAIDASDHCRTSALVSGSTPKAGRLAARFGVEHALTYDDFHDGVAREAYDAVYVCTPNARHFGIAETASAFGKHVLCEKPLATTAKRAARLVEICDGTDGTLMVAYRIQIDPVMRRVRDLVREGFVGDPLQIHADFSYPVLETGGPDQWRLDGRLAGGGALMDVGIYPLNTARFLLDADPVAVQGTTASPDAAFDEVDQHVRFELAFPDGVGAACTASFSGYASNYLELRGTEGRLRVERAFSPATRRRITLERGDVRTTVEGPEVNEVREQFDYFAVRVRSGHRPEPDGRDGLVDMRAMEAIYESAESGRRVVLD